MQQEARQIYSEKKATSGIFFFLATYYTLLLSRTTFAELGALVTQSKQFQVWIVFHGNSLVSDEQNIEKNGNEGGMIEAFSADKSGQRL